VPDAIFFDMDATLIFWPTPAEAVWESLARRYAVEANGVEPAVLLDAINRTRDWYWSDLERHRTGRLDLYQARREVVRLALTGLNIVNPELADKIADEFTLLREKDESVAPEDITVLKRLREQGLRLALITNGGADVQRAKIKKFGLEPYFDNILIEGEFGCGKPDERVFYHNLEKLKVKPADAWMVGDDIRYDIAPCRALGIFSVWVNGNSDTAHLAESVRPDKIIKSISEIPDLL
jgi:putative hydrolase of the HAD superfamily